MAGVERWLSLCGSNFECALHTFVLPTSLIFVKGNKAASFHLTCTNPVSSKFKTSFDYKHEIVYSSAGTISM